MGYTKKLICSPTFPLDGVAADSHFQGQALAALWANANSEHTNVNTRDRNRGCM